jgi:hypothetical protein
MKVNKIEVKPIKSKYIDVEHPTIIIDGVPLDLILHKHYPSKNFLGLVPTLINWIDDQKEKKLVQDRYKSKEKEVSLPVLMCPDDCDLWCTVIIAKVINLNGNVIWDKIGIDRSTGNELLAGYDFIGSRVEWLDLIPQYVFDEDEYKTEINKILLN